MSDVAARLRDLFLEAGDGAVIGTRSRVAVPRVPTRIAVLGPSPHAGRLGARIALGIGRAAGGTTALLASWEHAPPWSVPAWPACARLVSSLRERGIEAHGSGRLARVALPAPPREAATVLRRAAAASAAPMVLAVSRARDDDVDELLREHEHLVLVQAEDGRAAALALASVRALGAPVSTAPVPGRLRGELAFAGLSVSARHEGRQLLEAIA